MSHVADALRRTDRRATTPDVFRQDDHPWGETLDAGVAEEAGSGPMLRTEAVEVVAERAPTGAAAEPGARQQIAGLIERVFLPATGPAPRVVAMASIDAHDSSSAIAAAVAVALAQRTGARVAAIDLNFAKPTLHEHFSLAQAPGLAEALGSDAPLSSSATQVRVNLWVLPAGGGETGTELSAGSRARLQDLTEAFDYVVMTLEPLADSFGAGLATIADGVVLVVNADTTRRDTGRTVAERLQSCGAAILGAVLTNRRYPIPNAIYRRL